MNIYLYIYIYINIIYIYTRLPQPAFSFLERIPWGSNVTRFPQAGRRLTAFGGRLGGIYILDYPGTFSFQEESKCSFGRFSRSSKVDIGYLEKGIQTPMAQRRST